MKQRLDILVAEKFNLTRTKAQALIMAGNISVDGKQATKSGAETDSSLSIESKDIFPYVSRGALKLEKAIQEFKIDLSGKVICDIGASTGGFTDYALQHNTKKSYAIDCGYGQLDQKLRNDERVINMERTNIKDVESLPDSIDLFVIDVSFISLKKVLPQVATIIINTHKDVSLRGGETDEAISGIATATPRNDRTNVVALIKPQFEVGKEVADKYQGVIKDENIHQKVVTDIKDFAQKSGYTIKGLTESPIKGAKGNKEFLIWLQ
jgi:23S rRNA (cytidine1920-2'-O)/16S rRNA (cytidine1409-2'-O)-methyltransferase